MVAKLASFNDLATKALHVLVGSLPLNVLPRFTRLHRIPYRGCGTKAGHNGQEHKLVTYTLS